MDLVADGTSNGGPEAHPIDGTVLDTLRRDIYLRLVGPMLGLYVLVLGGTSVRCNSEGL